MSDSSKVTYRFRKASSSLVFLADPDYVCEYGVTSTFRWARYASGKSEMFSTSSTSSGVLTMTQVSTSGIYASDQVSLTLPSGLFNNAGYTISPDIFSSSYVVSINPIYDDCTAGTAKLVFLKGGSSTSAVSYRVRIDGTWK